MLLVYHVYNVWEKRRGGLVLTPELRKAAYS